MKKINLTIAIIKAFCVGECEPKNIRELIQQKAILPQDILSGSTILLSCTNSLIQYQINAFLESNEKIETGTSNLLNSNNKNQNEIEEGLFLIVQNSENKKINNLILIIDQHNENDLTSIISKILDCKCDTKLESGHTIIFESNIQQVSFIKANKMESVLLA